jgi:hypothetical protein
MLSLQRRERESLHAPHRSVGCADMRAAWRCRTRRDARGILSEFAEKRIAIDLGRVGPRIVFGHRRGKHPVSFGAKGIAQRQRLVEVGAEPGWRGSRRLYIVIAKASVECAGVWAPADLRTTRVMWLRMANIACAMPSPWIESLHSSLSGTEVRSRRGSVKGNEVQGSLSLRRCSR